MTDKKKKQEEKSVLQLISERLDEIADRLFAARRPRIRTRYVPFQARWMT